MKIIYLINSRKYIYHENLAKDFVSVTGGEIMDTAGADPGVQFYEIKEKDPDAVVTFDLAGHVFRTGNDALSLNNIYARYAHILFHGPDHYGSELKVRQNLSMFTYIPNGENTAFYRSRLSEVPNIEVFVPISCEPADDKERSDNLSNIRRWWDDFKEEAML